MKLFDLGVSISVFGLAMNYAFRKEYSLVVALSIVGTLAFIAAYLQ